MRQFARLVYQPGLQLVPDFRSGCVEGLGAFLAVPQGFAVDGEIDEIGIGAGDAFVW